MTLRDDVRAILDGGGNNALDAFGDMAPELAGTALGHFADTSTLADADALAPIVTAFSPVPFDPQLDGVGATPPVDMPVDGDPGAFDDVDDAAGIGVDADTDIDADTGVVDARPDEAGTEDDRELEAEDAAFGAGGAAIDPTVEPEDLLEELASVVESFQADDVPFDPIGVETLDEAADDFEPIDVAELEVDPGVGDFDVID